MQMINHSVQCPSDWWSLERVSGPYRGHYFAGYSRESYGEYFAYTKIFDHEPATVWDSPARAKVVARGARSHSAALVLAEARAMEWLERVHGPEVC
jgi:hypothetical protein